MNSSSLFRLEMVSVVDPEMVKWAGEGEGGYSSLQGGVGRGVLRIFFHPFQALHFFQR